MKNNTRNKLREGRWLVMENDSLLEVIKYVLFYPFAFFFYKVRMKIVCIGYKFGFISQEKANYIIMSEAQRLRNKWLK